MYFCSIHIKQLFWKSVAHHPFSPSSIPQRPFFGLFQINILFFIKSSLTVHTLLFTLHIAHFALFNGDYAIVVGGMKERAAHTRCVAGEAIFAGKTSFQNS